jgi:hypothetical protein
MDAKNPLLRAASSNIVRGFFIAMVAGLTGWHAALLTNSNKITPGESISNTWMAYLSTLTKADGDLRSADEVLNAAQITLVAQTLGMALHHSQIEEHQWKYIDPQLPTSVSLVSAKERPKM